MFRRVKSGSAEPPPAVEGLEQMPTELIYPMDPQTNRAALKPTVQPGDEVAAGQPVAVGERLRAHAALAGQVDAVTEQAIRIKTAEAQPSPQFSELPPLTAEALDHFGTASGLSGMGGSMFPYSIKLSASKAVHTIIINAVECEPGIEIDEALLLHDREPVLAGLRALRDVMPVKRTVLAVKKKSVARTEPVLHELAAEHLVMSNRYPGGAEKLIIEKLVGKRPPSGLLPFQWGCLVVSVASLWALGRAVREQRPSIDRPLTLVAPDGRARNLYVPVGTPAGFLAEYAGIEYDPDDHVLISGGMMMGRKTEPDEPVLKGTNAVFVLRADHRLRKAEEPCILCGACFDACPLDLHPTLMADRIRERKDGPALKAQLDECFLCGACSAVCPAEIPLVQYFHEGKQWLKTKK